MLNKAEKPMDKADKKEPVVIKKYANRRLYNTETSAYVTLEDLANMVRSERDFVVYDAKTGDELTHAVLTQIIVEQESRAGTQTLLPVPFLRQLIRFYGDTMERMVPNYLQVSLDTLTREQHRLRAQFANAFTPQSAFDAYQEHARKNLAMFEKAMTMFTPFNAPEAGSAQAEASGAETTPKPSPAHQRTEADKAGATAATPDSGPVGNELDELKSQLSAMQARLERLSKR